MELIPIRNFDQTTQIHALFGGHSIVAYCPETHVALFRSGGRSKGGVTTYLVGVREYACPRFKAFNDKEAVEKGNQWLAKNAKKYTEEIQSLRHLLPNAKLMAAIEKEEGK